jgi:hypothetical protein
MRPQTFLGRLGLIFSFLEINIIRGVSFVPPCESFSGNHLVQIFAINVNLGDLSLISVLLDGDNLNGFLEDLV